MRSLAAERFREPNRKPNRNRNRNNIDNTLIIGDKQAERGA